MKVTIVDSRNFKYPHLVVYCVNRGTYERKTGNRD